MLVRRQKINKSTGSSFLPTGREHQPLEVHYNKTLGTRTFRPEDRLILILRPPNAPEQEKHRHERFVRQEVSLREEPRGADAQLLPSERHGAVPGQLLLQYTQQTPKRYTTQL